MANYVTTPEDGPRQKEDVGLQRLGKTVIEHVETRIELLRLTVVGKAANGIASAVAWAVVGVLGLLMMLFGFIALALWIGQAFNPNNYAAGFGIVTAVFAVLAAIIFFTRGKVISAPLEDSLIASFLADDEEKNDDDHAKKANN